MKPRIPIAQKEMFQVEWAGLVALGHLLVKLGETIDWAVFPERLGSTFDGKTGDLHSADGGAALPEESVHPERRSGGGALVGESLLAAVLRPPFLAARNVH
jgi:hypothetical protein